MILSIGDDGSVTGNSDTTSTKYEYCSGFVDVYGQWNNGFPCPRWGGPEATYCCGGEHDKYCCQPADAPPSTRHTTTGLTDNSGLVAAVVVITVFVLMVFLASVCLFCRCCWMYKRRKHHRHHLQLLHRHHHHPHHHHHSGHSPRSAGGAGGAGRRGGSHSSRMVSATIRPPSYDVQYSVCPHVFGQEPILTDSFPMEAPPPYREQEHPSSINKPVVYHAVSQDSSADDVILRREQETTRNPYSRNIRTSQSCEEPSNNNGDVVTTERGSPSRDGRGFPKGSPTRERRESPRGSPVRWFTVDLSDVLENPSYRITDDESSTHEEDEEQLKGFVTRNPYVDANSKHNLRPTGALSSSKSYPACTRTHSSAQQAQQRQQQPFQIGAKDDCNNSDSAESVNPALYFIKNKMAESVADDRDEAAASSKSDSATSSQINCNESEAEASTEQSAVLVGTADTACKKPVCASNVHLEQTSRHKQTASS